MNWYKLLKLSARRIDEIEVRGHEVPIYVNPSASELFELIKKVNEVRGLINPDNTSQSFWWDSKIAEHCEVADAEGFDCPKGDYHYYFSKDGAGKIRGWFGGSPNRIIYNLFQLVEVYNRSLGRTPAWSNDENRYLSRHLDEVQETVGTEKELVSAP